MFAQHVPASVLTYTPGLPSLLSLATSMLGNAGDPSDGFESAYNPVAASLPANDAGYTASDQGFDDLTTAMSGFVDSGLDDLATELGDTTSALNAPENAFYGATQWLQGNNTLPGAPSSVAIPDFNVSTGIPAPLPLPNPPQSGPPSHPPSGVPVSLPSPTPPPGVPYPGSCFGPAETQGCYPGNAPGPCIDMFGMPSGCPGPNEGCISGSYEGSGSPPADFCP